MDLQAARQRRVGGLVAVVPEHPSPSERVDDQRRPEHAAVGVDRDQIGRRRAPRRRPAADHRGLKAGIALGVQQLAQMPVVKGGPAPRQAVPHRCRGRGEAHVGDLLADRGVQPERAQPRCRRGACRRGALADLVAIDDQDRGAGTRELAGDRQAAEARATDQHVGGGCIQRVALRAAGRRPDRHRRPGGPRCAGMNADIAARPTRHGATRIGRVSTSWSSASTRSRIAS